MTRPFFVVPIITFVLLSVRTVSGNDNDLVEEIAQKFAVWLKTEEGIASAADGYAKAKRSKSNEISALIKTIQQGSSGDARKRLSILRKEYDAMKNESVPVYPSVLPVNTAQRKIGAFGRIESGGHKDAIVPYKIIDSKNLVISYAEYNSNLLTGTSRRRGTDFVWLEGVDTSDIPESDEFYVFPQPLIVHCVGFKDGTVVGRIPHLVAIANPDAVFDRVRALLGGTPRQPFSEAKPPVRKWTDATGSYSVQAAFVSLIDDMVVLSKEDGTEISLPLNKLSAADRLYIRRANN